MNTLAIVFPGQGSQSVGMLSDWAQSFPSIQATFAEASEVLGFDLWTLIQEGPASKLNETQYTQVAMLTADVALYRVLQQNCSIQPSVMAGHSLGEYAALVAAQAIDFIDAVSLVQQRAQLMQQTVPLGVGAMAAIVGLTDERVHELCRDVSRPQSSVMPANFNAIGQVVVAGHDDAVERMIQAAQEQGARLAMKIPVSVPCHCALLAEAASIFHGELQQASFQTPSISVLNNVDAQPYQSAHDVRQKLEVQLHQPVQWVNVIQNMASQGVTHVIECGPGQVLSGLIKRIDRSLQTQSMTTPESLEKIATWCQP